MNRNSRLCVFGIIKDCKGRFILESAILFPILLLFMTSVLLLSSHIYINTICSFMTNRAALYAVDNASFNEVSHRIRLHKYIHARSNILVTKYKALLHGQIHEQEYTNPTIRLRQVNFINQLKLTHTSSEPESEIMKYPFIFKNHAEAASYLRDDVKGVALRLETPFGDRVLDAYKSEGILHQAFVTYTESQLLLQAKKDNWLLENNQTVNAVIWHFFMREIDGYKVPSKVLVQTLNKMGIVVYVHKPS